MKMVMSILILLMPMTAFAQNYQGMNEGDMQAMMQQLQKMKSCMENVDQGQLKMLEQRASQIEAEIKSLCDAGKRDKALKKAISFGKKMTQNPAMEAMKKCGEMMQGMPKGMMQGMMQEMPVIDQDYNDSSVHVCD